MIDSYQIRQLIFLDEACSRINLENKDLFKLEILKRRISFSSSSKMKKLLKQIQQKITKRAADLKTRECQIIEDIDKLSKKIEA